MGQVQELKNKPQPNVEIQEGGEIFFFYRPKVDREEAHSPDDVQRLYIVLRPESGETSIEHKQDPHSGKEGSKKEKAFGGGGDDDPKSEGGVGGGHGNQEVNIEKEPLLRFMVMGRKSLPDPSHRSRPYWGYVELVTTKIEDVNTALQAEEYETATRGHRHKPTARALGEGFYSILRHNPGRRSHTHLVYKLELPAHNVGKEPQEALNVEPEGSFLLQIKNPEQAQQGTSSRSGFRGLEAKRRASFPAHLQGNFGKSQRFLPADPPDFLNYEGCEFLLISASDDIEEELGLELKTEEVEEDDYRSCSDLVKTFGETASTAPLFRGTWV